MSARPAGKGKKRRWFRRLLILATIAVLLRVAISLALPVVLDKVAKGYGLRCEYERIDLSLLGADLEL
ncbi:MAG: hypothetical protein ACYS99_08310, partial [Planctomycetota bacterium]